jgi:hypothetical protein
VRAEVRQKKGIQHVGSSEAPVGSPTQCVKVQKVLHAPALISKAGIILKVSKAVQHSAVCCRDTFAEHAPLSLAGAAHIRQQVKVVCRKVKA